MAESIWYRLDSNHTICNGGIIIYENDDQAKRGHSSIPDRGG